MTDAADEQYHAIRLRLSPGAVPLLGQLVDIHLGLGNDPQFTRTKGRYSPAELHFSGDNTFTSPVTNVDVGALQDLVVCDLLHEWPSARGTPNYRVSGLGLNFHRWLLEQRGGLIDHVEESVRRFVTSEQFSATHTGAADNLRAAFDSLWSQDLDENALSQIGHHLRSAIYDLVADVGGNAAREDPVTTLKGHLSGLTLGDRERKVLEALTDTLGSVLRLDQRLAHVRDEVDKGRSAPTWEEARRATFTTAFVCYELSRAADST